MKEEAKKSRQLVLDLDNKDSTVDGNLIHSWSDISDKYKQKERLEKWKWTTIIEEIGKRLSIVDESEKWVDPFLKQSGRLRQAILRGRLRGSWFDG